MNTQISHRHGSGTPAIDAYIEKKIARLPRYFDQISSVEVILDQQRNEHRVECIISVDHADDLVSHANSDDLYAAIDLCTDRAVRQLTDHKSKLRDDKHHSSNPGGA